MTGEESLQLMCAVDPWAWAFISKIKLQVGEFRKSGYEYLIKPMQSRAKKKVIVKGTQLGLTQAFVLCSTHGLIHGYYPLGVFYLFPTSDLVSDFSSSRFDPLISENYDAIGRYVKSTDRIGLKQIGNGYLYLRGARLSQKVAGEAQSAKLSSLPADLVVFDERDYMSDEAIPKALARMAGSTVKEQVQLANPTIPDFGIDKEYQNSNRQIWVIKCKKCNTETSLDEEFPNCIKVRNDGTGFRACRKCGEEIFVRNGYWVERTKADSEGYLVSQLISPTVDPASILKAYSDPESCDTNITDVHRLMLGRAYIGQEERLRINDIYGCCSTEAMLLTEKEPCAMGVDVGKVLSVVIGKRTGPERYELIRMAELAEWNDLHDLAKKYNIKCCVMDLMCEMHKAREFQKQEKYPIYLCIYNDHSPTGYRWDMKKRTITANRTEIMDETHSVIMSTGKFKIPRMCSEVKVYAEQMCATAKVLEEDKITGGKTFRYRKLGPDHYRHATNYFLLAARRVPIAKSYRPFDSPKKPMVAKTQGAILGRSVGW